MLLGRHQDLAAQVAALLLRGQLVLPVDAGGTRGDHRLHQLVRVEGAAEAGLGVGDDRDQPVLDRTDALGVLDLVGAQQGVVDPADDLRDRVGRVERLVGVGVAGEIGVGRDLPAGEVDGLEAGLDLLDRLVAGQGAERIEVVLGVQLLPETLRAAAGEGVLLLHGATEPDDVLGGVVTLDVRPAGVGLPVVLDEFGRGGAHGDVLRVLGPASLLRALVAPPCVICTTLFQRISWKEMQNFRYRQLCGCQRRWTLGLRCPGGAFRSLFPGSAAAPPAQGAQPDPGTGRRALRRRLLAAVPAGERQT
ncbi:hypothetical protein SDC9_146010 [bioreactor metagenome]|uniref:Uncharacterized protein n=1 Tax=bioreactor metagenome TaxID=1076179 RepID=A0A645EAJ8_9ZZZZ